LPKGTSRIVVRLAGSTDAATSDIPAQFQLRFRRKSTSADHERLTAAALSRAGNLDRGRKVLASAEKTLCLKCHRLGEQGERVGPELTGLGGRFSKIHIIESILQPSRSISTTYQATLVRLADGRQVVGIQIAQTDAALTLVDSEGRQQTIARGDIEAIRQATTSAMPEGLEKKLTEEEFVDLVSYLTSLREAPAPSQQQLP
jgi:putative heme-binding domain-containing protein